MWVVLLVMLLSVPTGTHAARLFTTGFEESTTAADLATTMWDSAGAGASVGTTNQHSGSNHLTISGTTAKNIGRQLVASKTSGTIYVRFYWETTNAAAFDSRIFSDRSSGGSHAAEIIKLSTGKIRLRNVVTTTQVDSTLTVSTGTTYRFELEHTVSDTPGASLGLILRIYVGDSESITETLSILNEDVLPTNIRYFYWEESAVSSSITYYVDDIAINDESGSPQNSWPGPGNIALLSPNGDTSVAWTRGGTPAATNWEGVDDVPGTPNDATDYNYDSGSTNSDRLALTNLPGAVGAGDTMVLMDVYGRVSASASSGTFAFRIWDEGGTDTTGPTMTVSSTSWRIVATDEHQVYNLSGKTKANVDAFSAGYIAQSGAVEKRITALWANVEWKAAAGGSSACTLMLLGVGSC